VPTRQNADRPHRRGDRVHHPTYYRTRTVDGLSIFALDTKADEIAALLREFMQIQE
jgi:hypothetical protein